MSTPLYRLREVVAATDGSTERHFRVFAHPIHAGRFAIDYTDGCPCGDHCRPGPEELRAKAPLTAAEVRAELDVFIDGGPEGFGSDLIDYLEETS